jgi:hypothetical protein
MRDHFTGIALAPCLVMGLVVGLWSSSASAETPHSGVAASAEAVSPLAVGSRVPSVTVKDIDGKPVALDEEIGSEAVALIFYRGGW